MHLKQLEQLGLYPGNVASFGLCTDLVAYRTETDTATSTGPDSFGCPKPGEYEMARLPGPLATCYFFLGCVRCPPPDPCPGILTGGGFAGPLALFDMFSPPSEILHLSKRLARVVCAPMSKSRPALQRFVGGTPRVQPNQRHQTAEGRGALNWSRVGDARRRADRLRPAGTTLPSRPEGNSAGTRSSIR